MPWNVFTAQYSGLTYQRQSQYADGLIQYFSLGPNGANTTGFLAQYINTDPTSEIVLDRLKVTADYGDLSKNYLVFNLCTMDLATVLEQQTFPINELLNGNPNYSNPYFTVQVGRQAQVGFITMATADETLRISINYRVRTLVRGDTNS